MTAFFSRKILPCFVGTRQQNEVEEPFILEKLTTMATAECKGPRKEVQSNHLQWESLGLLSTLLVLPSLLSALQVSAK